MNPHVEPVADDHGPSYLETITTEELERLWEACRELKDSRAVRADTRVELTLLSAQLNHERVMRIKAKHAAAKAVSP